jgi:cap1 methyltransferase
MSVSYTFPSLIFYIYLGVYQWLVFIILKLPFEIFNHIYTVKPLRRTKTMESDTILIPNKRRRLRSFSSNELGLLPRIPQRPVRSSDCYDDVVDIYRRNDNNNTDDMDDEVSRNGNCAVPVRSSWLTNMKWICSSTQHTIPEESPPPIQQQQQPNVAIQSMGRGIGMKHDNQLQLEIQHIHQQLVEVKRRLGPTVERCAMHEHSHHKETNALNRASIVSSNHYRYIFEQARRFCNPYEVLGEGQNFGLNHYLFMNRSAIKLANIDAALGFCLTNITPSSPTNGPHTIFKFCDLCGAPGGFSEYILWRLRHATSTTTPFAVSECRGYGMSLVGMNEHGRGIPWKLQDRSVRQQCANSNVGVARQEYEICYGADGTGDIQNWENVLSLQEAIYHHNVQFNSSVENDNECGRVHLVLADGGFDAQRDLENQEEMAQKLVACEAAAALSLLRTGGTLVMKLFGFQTAVVRTMMRHFYFTFDSIIAMKPISSRPASTERYVVCFGFLGNPSGWTGQRWCNDLYLGRPCALSNYPLDINYKQKEAYLFNYLDEFDRDICALNLKANAAILWYLEKKCLNRVQGLNNDDEDDPYYEMSRISIPLFRIAWRLDS